MEQRSIIITGAGSGIGQATALRLGARGWTLGLFDIDGEALQTLQRQFEAPSHAFVVDVTDADSMRAAIETFVAKTGRLDAIFNCAGVIHFGGFEEVPLEQHQRAVDINVRGVMNGCHLAFPHLRRQPRSHVINMSSASSIQGIPGLANYSATKFWVKGLTEALASEWRQHGIQVCAIEPPFVRTPLLAGQQAEIIERFGVRLSAEDIAAVVERALLRRGPHFPVGLYYRALRLMRKLLPDALTALIIRRMAGY